MYSSQRNENHAVALAQAVMKGSRVLKEWRVKRITYQDREDAMILAMKLIRRGFDFEFNDTDLGAVIVCATKEGHLYASAVMRQK